MSGKLSEKFEYRKMLFEEQYINSIENMSYPQKQQCMRAAERTIRHTANLTLGYAFVLLLIAGIVGWTNFFVFAHSGVGIDNKLIFLLPFIYVGALTPVHMKKQWGCCLLALVNIISIIFIAGIGPYAVIFALPAFVGIYYSVMSYFAIKRDEQLSHEEGYPAFLETAEPIKIREFSEYTPPKKPAKSDEPVIMDGVDTSGIASEDLGAPPVDEPTVMEGIDTSFLDKK